MISNRPGRLAGAPYTGHQQYFLTFCTAFRHRAFELASTAEACVQQLRRSAAAHDMAVVAYCFMPDHVHVLVYGMSPQADLKAFVIHFKKLTGFAYRRLTRTHLWQPSYYDRILRDDESSDAVIRYILENPVRAGLSAQVGDYPFAGADLSWQA